MRLRYFARLQLLPLKISVFVMRFSNTFWHRNETFPKVVLRMKLFLSLQSFTCHLQYRVVFRFSLVQLSKSKFVHSCRTCVVRVALVSYSCCSCSTRVALVSHSCCSCNIRVALVQHSCRFCLIRVTLVSHSCHSYRTRVACVWYSCCKLDWILV